MVNCRVCGRGMKEGVTLHRENEKGVEGIWACEVHRTKPVDPEVAEIVRIVEDDNA